MWKYGNELWVKGTDAEKGNPIIEKQHNEINDTCVRNHLTISESGVKNHQKEMNHVGRITWK